MVKPGSDKILNDVIFRWGGDDDGGWTGGGHVQIHIDCRHDRHLRASAGDIPPEDFTEAPVESWTDNMVLLQPQFLKVSKIIYQSIDDDFVLTSSL